MRKIDISEWKEFKLSELSFKNYHGRRLKKSDRIVGTIPFVTAGKKNQGVAEYIGNNCETYESPITIDMFCNVFYHKGKVAGDDNVYFFVSDKISENCKLFIVTSLQSIIESIFAYVDQFRQDNADTISVVLPTLSDGSPNWQYMEEYIANIRKQQIENMKRLQQICNQEKNNVSIERWKDYTIKELFDIINGKGITKQEIYEHPGDLPAIQSGEENFGRIGYIDKDYCVKKRYAISKGECLTVARSGSSGFVGYQAKQCVVGDSAKILEPKFESNTLRLLFVRSLLMVNKSKYAYTDKVTKENYEKDTIKLPVTVEGLPDWQYMENYMKNIMAKQQSNLDVLQKL